MENSETLRKIPLAQDLAERRKFLLVNDNNKFYNVHYDLVLVIRKSVDKNIRFDKSEYEGKLKTKFNYHPKEDIDIEENLFLDFTGDVHKIIINGYDVENINFHDHRIFLDSSKILPNSSNEVTILFSCKYNHGGVGLHHYIDPIDNKEYLYTQFEPYDCHLMFPCFDQPDIKASLELSVIAPQEWTVLSNENENWSKPINDNTLNDIDIKAFVGLLSEYDRNHLLVNTCVLKLNYVLHKFNVTPRISSYLFALCAGHYYCINNPIEYEVPMRIFCRESLKKSGDPLEFFKITIEGMEWYKDFFGIKYPFNKYDQIFVPEYNMGAMENVGLVTYNECYCFKETPTQRLKSLFAITVLHELAHMWFGNLVTMKWWNDLWLNESFATFISHLCMSEAKGLKHYTTSWLIFNSDKGSAFAADQKSTTHPVMGEVKNTDVAETHFDEIVYEKGSSILQQLFKFIGFENFSNGIRNYFQIYKWENTEFSNFIDQMVKATGNDKLTQLCDSYLKKSGLNQISVSWEVDTNNKIKSFNLIQTPCLEAHPNLQTHLCDMILIYENGSILNYDNITINNEPLTIVYRVFGVQGPSAVIINYNDWAYFKLRFDHSSIKFLQNNLYSNILHLSELTRQIFYRSIFDSARDSVISAVQYMDIINSLLPQETNEDLINFIIRNLYSVVTYYIPHKFHSKYSNIAYKLIYNLLSRPNQSDDTIKVLISNLINLTNPDDKQNIELIRNWLEHGFSFTNTKNEKLDIKANLLQQKLRFNCLYKIFASNIIEKELKNKLLEIECTRDNNSDDSELARFRCRASLPDKAIKEELFNKYVNESTKESLYKMISSMSGFVQMNQIDLIEDFLLVKFFEVCLDVSNKNDHFYTESFIECLSPIIFVKKDVIEKMEMLIEKAETDSVKRKLTEEIDDLKRFYKAHILCEEYLNKAV